MSVEHAKKYLDNVLQDPNLQKELPDVHGQLTQLGKKHGYNFSSDELKDELRRRWQEKDENDVDTCMMCVCI